MPQIFREMAGSGLFVNWGQNALQTASDLKSTAQTTCATRRRKKLASTLRTPWGPWQLVVHIGLFSDGFSGSCYSSVLLFHYPFTPWSQYLLLRPRCSDELNLVVHELDVGPEPEDLEDGVVTVVGRLAGEQVVGHAHRWVRQAQQHAPRRLVEDGGGLQ